MTDKTFSDNEMGFRNRIKSQAVNLRQSIQNKIHYRPYTWKEECCDIFMCDKREEG